MPINATNYDGTKDYKIAEIGDVHHPNLLINGDFQVNQRSKTTFVNNSNTLTYTVDMWGVIKGTVTKTANGVTVTANQGQEAYFGQYLEVDNTTIQVTAKVNGTVYTLTFRGERTSLNFKDSSGSITLEYTSNKYLHVLFTVAHNKSVNIEYVDAVYGNEMYAHEKEDYGIAQYRCLRYFYRCGTGYTRTVATGYTRNDKSCRFAIQYPTMMASQPTIKLNGEINLETANFLYTTVSNITPSQVSTERATITGVATNQQIEIKMPFSVYFSDSNLSSYIDVSCEPR